MEEILLQIYFRKYIPDFIDKVILSELVTKQYIHSEKISKKGIEFLFDKGLIKLDSKINKK